MTDEVNVLKPVPEIECDHDWEMIDDSFDHAFGRQEDFYMQCIHCNDTREFDSERDIDINDYDREDPFCRI